MLVKKRRLHNGVFITLMKHRVEWKVFNYELLKFEILSIYVSSHPEDLKWHFNNENV